MIAHSSRETKSYVSLRNTSSSSQCRHWLDTVLCSYLKFADSPSENTPMLQVPSLVGSMHEAANHWLVFYYHISASLVPSPSLSLKVNKNCFLKKDTLTHPRAGNLISLVRKELASSGKWGWWYIGHCIPHKKLLTCFDFSVFIQWMSWYISSYPWETFLEWWKTE